MINTWTKKKHNPVFSGLGQILFFCQMEYEAHKGCRSQGDQILLNSENELGIKFSMNKLSLQYQLMYNVAEADIQ